MYRNRAYRKHAHNQLVHKSDATEPKRCSRHPARGPAKKFASAARLHIRRFQGPVWAQLATRQQREHASDYSRLRAPALVADSTTLLESLPGSSLEHLQALASCPLSKVTWQRQLQVVDRQKRAENCGGCAPPPRSPAIYAAIRNEASEQVLHHAWPLPSFAGSSPKYELQGNLIKMTQMEPSWVRRQCLAQQ